MHKIFKLPAPSTDGLSSSRNPWGRKIVWWAQRTLLVLHVTLVCDSENFLLLGLLFQVKCSLLFIRLQNNSHTTRSILAPSVLKCYLSDSAGENVHQTHPCQCESLFFLNALKLSVFYEGLVLTLTYLLALTPIMNSVSSLMLSGFHY